MIALLYVSKRKLEKTADNSYYVDWATLSQQQAT
jgi:hypothetical protein